MGILMSHKAAVEHKECHNYHIIIIKESIHQEDIAILNVYIFITGASKYMK